MAPKESKLISRNLVDHPAIGDRYQWQGKIINVCRCPLEAGGHRLPIFLLVDGEKQIWTRSPWLKMHKTAVLLRLAEQFIEQIEATGRPMSVEEE